MLQLGQAHSERFAGGVQVSIELREYRVASILGQRGPRRFGLDKVGRVGEKSGDVRDMLHGRPILLADLDKGGSQSRGSIGLDGSTRGLLPPSHVMYRSECHGLAPWMLTFPATRGRLLDFSVVSVTSCSWNGVMLMEM